MSRQQNSAAEALLSDCPSVNIYFYPTSVVSGEISMKYMNANIERKRKQLPVQTKQQSWNTHKSCYTRRPSYLQNALIKIT